jgi:hypothetical protein
MNAPATATSKTPREIGREMLRLREQFNLTPQEVAARIHIRPRYITAMEEARYDLMPGKVYARGYIQTYAEFLGLDADAVLKQCFDGETVQAAPLRTVSARPASVSISAGVSGQWRVYGVLTVVALATWLIYYQMHKAMKPEQPAVSSVMPVPETMLATIRTLVMPTSANFECLTGSAPLGCTYSGAVSHLLSDVMNRPLPFAEPIDVSGMAVAPAANEAEVQLQTEAAPEAPPAPRKPRMRRTPEPSEPVPDAAAEPVPEETPNE